MTFEECRNCGKPTGHKRALGWGTFFGAVLTGGLSLLLIPFYPTRCIVCGCATDEGPLNTATSDSGTEKTPRLVYFIWAALIALGVLGYIGIWYSWF